MLLGDLDLIQEAKVWQRRAGGNVFSLTYEVVDCERGSNENIGTFRKKWEKMRDVQAAVMAATEQYTAQNGERVVRFVADPATCCQARVVFTGYTAEKLVATRDAVEERIDVRVFEKLKPKQTVDEVMNAERNTRSGSHASGAREAEDLVHEIEWM